MSLKLTNLAKNFGSVEVLRDINIEIEKGDFLVLLGGSGCGKTTLLNCVAGLEETTAGRIEINGRDVTRFDPSDRNVAMVFQSYALYPTMKVARNISFGLECQGVPRADRQRAVERVAGLLQIADLLDRKPSQLSGGQRQRVAVGRALVRDPEIFLLDEPMSNLDVKLRNQMRLELRELHGNLGATFVLVTHDQIEAMTMATKVAVLDGGHVQQFGTPYDIYYTPRNRFVAEFVGLNKMNFLAGRITYRDAVPAVAIGDHIALLSHYVFSEGKPEEGQRVLLGIRPENIYRSRDRLEGHTFLQAERCVRRKDMTGGDLQVWFEFEDQMIACRVRSSRAPDLDERTTFFLDLQNASLFDAVTEIRL